MNEQASEIIENLKKYEINPTIECREFLRNYARKIHEEQPDFEVERMLFRAEGLLGLFQKYNEEFMNSLLNSKDLKKSRNQK